MSFSLGPLLVILSKTADALSRHVLFFPFPALLIFPALVITKHMFYFFALLLLL